MQVVCIQGERHPERETSIETLESLTTHVLDSRDYVTRSAQQRLPCSYPTSARVLHDIGVIITRSKCMNRVRMVSTGQAHR